MGRLWQPSANDLSSALDIIDDMAELRAVPINADFFTQLTQVEAGEWVADLARRTIVAAGDAPAACLLDTGVDRGHPLLEASLDEADMHSCVPSWGIHDHHGHGTEMAGISLYGDLRTHLVGTDRVQVAHRLESVKILPPLGINDPDLYGAITAEAVARTEVQAAHRRRVFVMALTAEASGIPGTPTSWSAAVDVLAAGREFDTLNGRLGYIDAASLDSHRLFVVATGNVRHAYDAYIDCCDLAGVEDPAQSWNALTVGAYAVLADPTASGGDFGGWSAVAPPGDLSPFSRTSVGFQRQWPMKPEIVLEGGNVARLPEGSDFDWPASLQVVTTAHEPATRLLTSTNGTSAATASAGYLAASISAAYPALWPETVRGLMVHAARWTEQMGAQFATTGNRRRGPEAIARRYGFGVPTLDRCLRSATNALTLIVQDSIHFFETGKLREMHLHDLPWPREALGDLGATPVQLRVTLSYFVEPSPTRRGWRRRYRYASHQLRFELQHATETNEEFRKRLNKRALDEEEERPTGGDDAGWFLGSDARNRGSIHSDIWNGTAAELAARGRVAVFPVTGWWKELQSRDRSALGARYALLLSIDSPAEDVDLWTPVAQEVGLPVVIEA